MAFTDFLFNGTPPPQVSSASSGASQLPLWYQQYQGQLFNQASSIAGTPYQPYQSQQVAQPTDMQNQGWNSIAQNSSNWQAPMQQAQQTVGGIAQQPYDQGKMNQFVSPYLDNVVGGIRNQGMDMWKNQILPSIQDQFDMNGQSGSTLDQRQLELAGSTLENNIMAQQANAGNQAYGQAQQNYGNFQGQQLNAGTQMGALAQQQSALTGQEGQQLTGAGAEQRGINQQALDTSYQNFQTQQQFPYQQASWMSSILQNSGQVPQMYQTNQSSPYSGQSMGSSPLSQLAGYYSLMNGIG